jgi:hypothetical protein
MRKRLYQFYNFLSSYPILFLLIIGIAAMFHIGGQYKPLEVAQMLKLEAKMQLKQKRQSMQKEFDDIEMIDLEKRYTLFNQEFLKLSDLEEGDFFERTANTLELYGWGLEGMENIFLDDTTNKEESYAQNKGAHINGVIVHLEANSLRQTLADGDPFLPLYASTNAMKFMWSRPPFKEYQRIKLFRTDEGFGFEASLFMPLRHAESLDESEEEKPI